MFANALPPAQFSHVEILRFYYRSAAFLVLISVFEAFSPFAIFGQRNGLTHVRQQRKWKRKKNQRTNGWEVEWISAKVNFPHFMTMWRRNKRERCRYSAKTRAENCQSQIGILIRNIYFHLKTFPRFFFFVCGFVDTASVLLHGPRWVWQDVTCRTNRIQTIYINIYIYTLTHLNRCAFPIPAILINYLSSTNWILLFVCVCVCIYSVNIKRREFDNSFR